MSKIYVISGLGADERVFRNIDFGEHSVTFVHWIVPEKKETIENYASRIITQIKTPNPIVIGLSFGGIMAIEVAKRIDVQQLILISSAKNRFEIPWYYRFIGKMRLHKCVPQRMLRKANRLTYWLFGTEQIEERTLLKTILEETNSTYLQWAIHQIVTWKSVQSPKRVFHIHGTKDRLLPQPASSVNEEVIGGGHFMILNKSAEINPVLNKVLATRSQ